MDGGLVIRPGERMWLERYLNDARKFIFNTYKVSNTEHNKKVIENNGKLKIEFFDEIAYTFSIPTWSYFDYSQGNRIQYDYAYNTCFANNATLTSETFSIETGRIEKGENSSQQLSNNYNTFYSIAFHTVEYHMLPISQKELFTSNDLREYCTDCGLKITNKPWKFCPKCGTKLK